LRATAGFDRQQVLQIGWLYDLPMGKGKSFAKTGVSAAVLGGWEVNGVMSAYTGTPFTVGDSTPTNAPDNTQTANLVNTSVGQPGLIGSSGLYYDKNAFASVGTINTFGNSGRNILRNPGLWNTDINLSRNFKVKERATLQFRAEAYNLANTSHFNGPSSTSVTGGSNFMRILSSYGERQVRFALRLQW
jgi:hypothetical protein